LEFSSGVVPEMLKVTGLSETIGSGDIVTSRKGGGKSIRHGLKPVLLLNACGIALITEIVARTKNRKKIGRFIVFVVVNQ